MTPSSDPASGLGEGKGGQTAVVSAPGQPASQPAVARTQDTSRGKSLPRPRQPNFRPRAPPLLLRAGGRTGSHHSPGGPIDSQGEPLVPPEPPAITTLLHRGLRDRARPSSSLAYFSCPLPYGVFKKTSTES